jgi:putative transposase
MLIQKAFRYELMSNETTRVAFPRFAGSKRHVWNAALNLPKYLGYTNNCKLLQEWKVEKPWMKEIHSQVLQQGLKDLDQAFKNFFEKRADRPKPKIKGKCQDSFRFPQHFKIDEGNSRIYLPKIGWVRYRNSRALRGVAKSITISRKGDKWFASIQVEFEVEDRVHLSTSEVGVDLGVVRFATLSNDTHIEPLNALKKRAARLRRYQRAMARKQKFSKNWKKAKAKVAKLHLDVANSRKDFLQKLTTTQTKTHSLIVIEDLKVSNMSRSAAGTIEMPGSNVRQKAGLNRSILEQGWSEYRRQLEYKAVWTGGRVIAIAAMNTSQTCPCCGHISKDNRKAQASFACVECGYAANADYVASVNILAAGQAVLRGDASKRACGGVVDVGPPMKQVPSKIAA